MNQTMRENMNTSFITSCMTTTNDFSSNWNDARFTSYKPKYIIWSETSNRLQWRIVVPLTPTFYLNITTDKWDSWNKG